MNRRRSGVGATIAAHKAKLGTGARFAALRQSLAHRKDVRDPDAVAASIGRKNYGAARMAKWAAKGRH